MAQALRAGLRNGGLRRGGFRPGLGNGSLFAIAPLDMFFARTRTLDSRVTFTRASSGTYVDSNGLLKTATTNEPRFDHNPTTGESLGLLVEEQRTNLLLNSGTLSTQNVTVTAVAHTLSFTGTGTITLSGASTAGPLVGVGTGEASRVSLTFTPTAGTLGLTVSGTVTVAQLEAGGFRTSYITTTSATATRSADVASITGLNFSSWYRQDQGTVYASISRNSVSANDFYYLISDGTNNNRIGLATGGTGTEGRLTFYVSTLGVSQCVLQTSANYTQSSKNATAYEADFFAYSVNGTTAIQDLSGTVPVCNQLCIGAPFPGAPTLNLATGTISRITYWPQRLNNMTLQVITQ